ncbi:Hexose carrier protein HEX6 [Platanthera zijinensis]|uniref:Hexose carrier protein HEX6 n=1 Tax=Platanthera zijinensis TaxID=2320716 RepID=A0AAP0BJS5_9ASPA
MAMEATVPASPPAKYLSAGNTDRRKEIYEGKVTSFVVLSCMVAASGGILFGYDIGISGGVTATSSFLKRFFPHVYEKMQSDTHISNYCKFNSEILTSFTSSLYIAGLFASLFASHITERYGRRASILAGGTLFLAGSAVGGTAVSVGMLILARILLGFGIGFTNQSIPLYLSEMSPARYRGALTGGFDIFVSFGVLVANLVNYGTQKITAGWGWRISLSLAALPATLLIIGALFLPETPSNLIHRRGGDLREARSVLQKIRGTTDVEKELEDLATAVAAASKAAAEEHPFSRIFRRNYRPHLVMALFIPFFQQVTGINAVNFYAPVMFRIIGQKESASLMSAVITRCISLSCTVLASLFAVDRLGRRVLFIFGGAVMAASHLVLGGLLAGELHDHGSVSSMVAYLVLIMVCVFVGSFGWSWGPLAWLVTSEIFPLEIRSAGQSIQVAVNFLSTFAVAQSVLEMLCFLRFGIFFLFGVFVMVMTVFVFFLLPETKGIPLDQMGGVWRQHWYWKRFVAVDGGGDRVAAEGTEEEEETI